MCPEPIIIPANGVLSLAGRIGAIVQATAAIARLARRLAGMFAFTMNGPGDWPIEWPFFW